MHSKWKIWDYLSGQREILNSETRVYAYSTFDSYVFKMIKESFDYSHFENKKLKVILGKELTANWIRENLCNLDLFGSNESYLIQNAESVSEESLKALLDIDSLELDNRFIILNFSKDGKAFKKMTKVSHTKLQTISIESPPFWEDGELIRFFANYFKIYLDIDAIEEIRSEIEFDFSAYYRLFSNISLNYGDQLNITKEDIEKLFSDFKVDKFELADLFGTRKFNLFYEKMVRVVDKQYDLNSVITFLESHLIKMYDPSTIESKPRLNKYDKKILAQSKLWNKPDLAKAIQYFSELLVQVKCKNDFVDIKLKLDYLKYLSF